MWVRLQGQSLLSASNSTMYYLIASLAITAFVGGGAYVTNHTYNQGDEVKSDASAEVTASSTTETAHGSDDSYESSTEVNSETSLFLGL